jgi:MFS family permease
VASRSVSLSGIFASRSFRQYYTGQALSLIGDGMRTLAVPLLVYKLTGSAVSTSLSYICELTPFAVFGLFAGSLADRMNRRTLMIAADSVRCAIMCLFALLFARHTLTIPMIYGGLVLLSICAAVFVGGQASSIPFLLGRERGTQAIAALNAAENTSNFITPVAGAALFNIFGPLPALTANAITYLLSQISLARIPTLGPEHASGIASLRHIIDDVALGFRVLFADRTLRAITFASLALNAVGFGGYSIIIPFLKTGFHASDVQVGIFLSISAAGAICGSLVAGGFAARWPFGRALCVALTLDSVLFLPVILTRDMWIAGAFWAVANACANFEVAQIVGFRLRIIPEDLVGRVFGAVRLFVLCGIPPGAMIFAYLADRYNAHFAMTIAALSYLAIAIGAIANPAIRQERR